MRHAYHAEVYVLTEQEGGVGLPIGSNSDLTLRVDETELACAIDVIPPAYVQCGDSGAVVLTLLQSPSTFDALDRGDVFTLLQDGRKIALGQVTGAGSAENIDEAADEEEEFPRLARLLAILASNVAVLLFARNSPLLIKVCAMVAGSVAVGIAWAILEEIRGGKNRGT